MKNLFKNISSLIIFALLPGLVLAKPVGMIFDVKGNAFIIKGTKVKQIRDGDLIEDLSEIMTEEGAQITFSDYYDHKFHLSGSGQVRFFNKVVELKKGYLWVQSYQTDDFEFFVHTANAQVAYSRGEGIISFDLLTGKTQALVMAGEFNIQNPLMNGFKVNIKEGNFSFVDEKYENGTPRWATPVGYKSFQKVLHLFQEVRPLDKNNQLVRETIASTGQSARPKFSSKLKKRFKNRRPAAAGGLSFKPKIQERSGGKIIYLGKSNSDRQRKKDNLLKLYENKVHQLSKKKRRKTFAPSYGRKSKVKIRVFGKRKRIHSKKAPTKVARSQKPVGKNTRNLASGKKGMKRGQIPENTFESSLIKNYKTQMRHSNEVNNLINDLKTYDMDYKRNH